MKSVYDYLKPTNQPSKNGFDLSSLQTYTAKVGQLIPEVCIETVPNANYRVQIDAFTRTMPLNTAAFARIKENRYVCFVPYSQLWQDFNQMIVGRSDPQDARHKSDCDSVPTFNIGNVLDDLRLAYDSYHTAGARTFDVTDQLGYSLADGAAKLMDMLGYGYYQYFVKGGVVNNPATNTRANLWRILAYNKIWYNFFRNSVYDNDLGTLGFGNGGSSLDLLSTPAQMFNVNDVEGSSASDLFVENFRSQRSISKLFQMRYIPYKQDEFNGLMPDTQYGAVSSISLDITGTASVSGSLESTGSTILKSVLHETQGGYTIFKSGLPSPISSSDVGSLRWPAGNHLAIGFDEVHTPAGQQAIGKPLIVGNNSKLVVDVDGVESPINSIESGIVPDGSSTPVGGSHSHNFDYTYLNTDSQNPHSHRVAAGADIAQLNGADVLRTIRFVADSGGTIDFDGAGFNVLDLVEAQSIQKWRQRALLAGNRTNDNFRAHYGVAPRYDIDLYPDMIGSSDNTISIQEVVSTADTSTEEGTSNLGDIAGKGYGVSDKKYFNYQSNDFGVLMVLYAARPEVQYNSFGLDRSNQLVSRNDYFVEEFQNNGLEPVTSKDFLMSSTPIKNLGFSPRFRNYKAVLSKVHGLFNELHGQDVSLQDFENWVVARRDIYSNYNGHVWHDPSDAVISTATSVRYVNPALLDTIFALSADSTESTDHFMINSFIQCLATLPMSRLGLPSF